MIAEIQAIACLLASEPLTMDEFVGKFGTVTHDYGVNVLVKPDDPQFKEVSVGRDVDFTTRKPLNTPEDIDITPLKPPTVEALVQAFGPYKKTLTLHYTSPPRIRFYLNMSDRPYRVVMGADIRDGRAIRIRLRREKRSNTRVSALWACRSPKFPS